MASSDKNTAEAASWQASTPAQPKNELVNEANPSSWSAGQGGAPAVKAPTKAAEPAAVVPTGKVTPAESSKKSVALQFLSMGLEGVVFGSLYGWAVLRNEGVKSAETRKYLGIMSVLGPLLVMDTKDCCSSRLGNWDFGLIALHMMLALRTCFERSLQSFGPWSLDKSPADNTFSIVAFIVHFRCFLHLLTKEAKASLAKKVALMAGFSLGANLTVM